MGSDQPPRPGPRPRPDVAAVLLLDTHVLIWLIAGSGRIGPRCRDEIQLAFEQKAIAVSSITFWEIVLLVDKRRLELDQPIRSLRLRLKRHGLQTRSVDDEIAIRSVELGSEGLLPDPADRMIVATAETDGMRLLTADRLITAWAQQTRAIEVADPHCLIPGPPHPTGGPLHHPTPSIVA